MDFWSGLCCVFGVRDTSLDEFYEELDKRIRTDTKQKGILHFEYLNIEKNRLFDFINAYRKNNASFYDFYLKYNRKVFIKRLNVEQCGNDVLIIGDHAAGLKATGKYNVVFTVYYVKNKSDLQMP